MPGELEKVFKALADSTRRYLLDTLRLRNGQTLNDLCAHLDMTRQAVAQHVAVLAEANLISTVRSGREKLHYLNPVPLREVRDRWFYKFEESCLEVPGTPGFRYVTYIDGTPERVWTALTVSDMAARWRDHGAVSHWRVGSPWELRRTDGTRAADVFGTVLESSPPVRLVLVGARSADVGPDDRSRITFDIRPHGVIVRLAVVEENLPGAVERERAAERWAAVLSNVKSLIETGSLLSGLPWLEPQR